MYTSTAKVITDRAHIAVDIRLEVMYGLSIDILWNFAHPKGQGQGYAPVDYKYSDK